MIGGHGQYHWLSSADHEMAALVRLCPDALIGRRVAVTSFDGGALTISEQERIYVGQATTAGSTVSTSATPSVSVKI